MIKIEFTTKTPLCQIDKIKKASSSENSLIQIKRQKVLVENKYGATRTLNTPIYTGNGFRGMLRRSVMEIMLKALAKNSNQKITDEDFHLMNAGGGNLHNRQLFKTEEKVRELNPLVSIFGTSLAIEGKIRVSNMVPLDTDEDTTEGNYLFKTNDTGYVSSSIVNKETLVKRDGILDRDSNSAFLAEETVVEWTKKCEANASNRVTARVEKEKSKNESKSDTPEIKDEIVKKETIQGIFDRESVSVGVSFFGGISEKSDLTGIEKGMLYLGLEKAVYNNLGGGSSLDYGKVEYTIRFDEKSVLETQIDKYGEVSIYRKSYTREVKNCIADAEEFLNNITIENFELSKVLIKTK